MADISKPVIAEPAIDIADIKLNVGDDLIRHLADPHVSISLKYYHKKSECWSDWRERELKDLSNTIDKLRSVSASELKRGGGPHFDSHKGPPKGPGFKRPKNISEDMQFYEIGLNQRARIHGILVGSVFFLVWLDRGHKVFPSGK
jgi:hypothetical protein